MYACMHMCLESKGQPLMSSSKMLSVSFETGSFIKLKLIDLAVLAGQRAPGILVLPLSALGLWITTLGIFMSVLRIKLKTSCL